MKTKIIPVLIGVGFSLAPSPLMSIAQADPPYKNCTEAHKDGAYNIKKGDPGYESRLDRDGDGIACEPKPR
ncbi:Excalibur domain-containing protein [Mycobacteroides abscessus subsp. bolletii]|nr:Excalibur domain-containing protein [Mycobacteroides abscessus subsp. bolletii]SLH95802.1 Excalibur domain-containing protein [Mycobacteroides abscessus subsp. massiliense]SLI83939.1 Excalibur domain-containing protein [Mycobacteroides abscessus subsp. massiliense]